MLKKITPILLCVLFITGCATPKTVEQGMPIRESAVSLIENGKTTEDNLIIMFGQPSSVITNQDGSKTMHFVHSVGIMPFGKMPDVNVTQLIINLNSDGTVKDYQYIQGNNPAPTVR